MKSLIDYLKVAGVFAPPLFIVYLAFASAVWQWRNPLANRMTVFTEFRSVISLKKLPEYQPRH